MKLLLLALPIGAALSGCVGPHGVGIHHAMDDAVAHATVDAHNYAPTTYAVSPGYGYVDASATVPVTAPGATSPTLITPPYVGPSDGVVYLSPGHYEYHREYHHDDHHDEHH